MSSKPSQWLRIIPIIFIKKKKIKCDCQAKPKIFLKGTTSVGSCYPTEPNNVECHSTKPQTLQKDVGSSCPARPTVLGFDWATGSNIFRYDCAAIYNDIIICIINILNFIIINIKIIIICIKNIFLL